MSNPNTYAGHVESVDASFLASVAEVAAISSIPANGGAMIVDNSRFGFADRWLGDSVCHPTLSTDLSASLSTIQGASYYRIVTAQNTEVNNTVLNFLASVRASFGTASVNRDPPGSNTLVTLPLAFMHFEGSQGSVSLNFNQFNVLSVTLASSSTVNVVPTIGGRPIYLPVNPTPIHVSIGYGLNNQTTRNVSAWMRGMSGVATASATVNSMVALNLLRVGRNGGGSSDTRFNIGSWAVTSGVLSQANRDAFADVWCPRTDTLPSLVPPVVIVCLGTSLTSGWLPQCGRSWPVQLAARFGSSAVVHNWGIPGYSTDLMELQISQVSQALVDIRAQYPNSQVVLVCEFGANDAGADGRSTLTTASQYFTRMSNLYTVARAAGIGPCYLLTPWPFMTPYTGNDAAAEPRYQRAAEYATTARTSLRTLGYRIIDVAADPMFTPRGATVADCRTMVSGLPFWGAAPIPPERIVATMGTRPSVVDGIHPGPVGIDRIAQLVGNALAGQTAGVEGVPALAGEQRTAAGIPFGVLAMIRRRT